MEKLTLIGEILESDVEKGINDRLVINNCGKREYLETIFGGKSYTTGTNHCMVNDIKQLRAKYYQDMFTQMQERAGIKTFG